MSKHGRVYSVYQLDIGAGSFKRAFVTHRNAVRTSKRRKKKKQRSDEREEVKTRNCFICVTKNSSEKLSNQVVIETERTLKLLHNITTKQSNHRRLQGGHHDFHFSCEND